MVGRVKYDRPFMDNIVRKKDTIFAEYCEEGKLCDHRVYKKEKITWQTR